jgi:hypothetical protein
VCAGDRLDAPIEGFHERLHGLRTLTRKPGDGRHIAQDVLHAMVELGHQQILARLIALPVRYVENRAHHAQAGFLLVWDTLTAIQEPANLAVGPDDLELQLAAPRLR